MNAQRVADGVHRIDSHGVVNWYLVEDGERLTAIDAGLPPDWDTLGLVVRDVGRRLTDLDAVVLTHAHTDHTGFAEQARVDAGARVYVPAGDEELARHQLRAAKSERNPLLYMLRHGATRRLFWTMGRVGAMRSRPLREFEVYRDGEVLDVPGNPVALATHGHTFGHTALHLPDRDVLFAGDALVTRNPYTDETGPRLVSRAATADSEEALRSLDRIADSGAGTLLPGHGDPWTGGAAQAVALARAAGLS